MTVNEAINYLEDAKIEFKIPKAAVTARKTNEALDMAIKALEQQPCEDAVSRQAAIDRINKQREHLQPDIYPQDKIGDAAYRICAEFIERLPSAQPVIIRCKDCNYYFYDANFAKSWCNRMSGTFMVKPDSYCSFAVKRKENR